MSNVSKKMLMAAAGSAGGAGLDIDECFSCFLWTGTGSGFAVNNGIDLSGEGGLVWIKKRNAAKNHGLMDTEQGLSSGNSRYLKSNNTDAQATGGLITAYNSNGFTLGAADMTNGSGEDYVSWTFRNSPMFQVVKYTGDNTSNRTISHNLGSTPGMIICKSTSSGQWGVWHRSLSGNNGLRLDTTDAAGHPLLHDNSTVNSTSFEVSSGGYVLDNQNGNTYVAYLFAHHANDGSATGFGSDGDSPVISCGSFTTGGSGAAIVNVGFPPQWIMIKRTDGTGNWQTANTTQGWDLNGTNPLFWNLANAESDVWGGGVFPTSTGFEVTDVLGNNRDFIYMAIAHPISASSVPTDATKVFSIDTIGSGAPYFDSNHIVDMALVKSAGASGDWYNYARHIGEKYLATNTTAAEASASEAGFDFMNGHIDSNWGGTNAHSWMWKRAPSYFDVITTTTSNADINHSLGVVPELTIYRNRSGDNWAVFAPTDGVLFLNSSQRSGGYGNGSYLNQTYGARAAATTVSDGGGYLGNNVNVIIYLFASLSGVSKIGGVVHSGTTNVDAGFSSGSRFVLVKRVDGVGDWLTWDGTRGIVSGNDPYLALNSTAAEVTNTDYIDPYSAGFTLTSNLTSGTYLYYAIA